MLRHQKFWAVLLIALMLPLAVCAYGAGVLAINESALPRAQMGTPYTAQLTASGGELAEGAAYTFTLAAGSRDLPRGLSLAEDGTISGTPLVSGRFSGITYQVTDSAGQTATKRIPISISVKTAHFKVVRNNYEYDGQPHAAEITAVERDIAPEDYTVTCGGAETQTEVGTYSITISGDGLTAKGYKPGSITPKSLVITTNTSSSISLTSATVPYDGNPHALTPAVLPEAISADYTVTYQGRNGTNYAETTQPPVDSGAYLVTARTTNSNYVERTATATLVIAAPRVDFTVTDAEFIYDGQPHRATVTAEGLTEGEDFTVTYDNAATEAVEAEESVTAAGTYNLRITLRDPNQAVGNLTTGQMVIQKRTVNFTVTENDYTYDGAAHSAAVTSDYESCAYTVAYGEEQAETVTAAGEYAIQIALTDSENYEIGTVEPSTLTIRQAVVDFTVTGAEISYDGQPHRATVTAEGLTEGEDFTVTYDNAATEAVEAEETVTGAGTYNIQITLQDPNQVIGNLTTGQLVIQKRTVNFTVTENDYTYDGAAHSATVASDYESCAYTVAYGEEHLAEVSAVGEYEIHIALTDSENYEIGTVEPSALTIRQAVVDFAVTDTEFTYDSQPHAATVAAGALPEGVTFAVTYDNTATEAVEADETVTGAGVYAIRIAFADPGCAVGTMTREQLTIGKAPVDFSAEPEEIPYDGEAHTLNFAPNAAQLFGGDVLGPEDYTVTYEKDGQSAAAMRDAGVYTVQVTLNHDNYQVGAVTPAEAEIQFRTVSFTVSDLSHVYDGQPHRATVTAEGLTEGEDFTVTYDNTATEAVETDAAATGAGSYAVLVTLQDPNHQAQGLDGATLEISKRPVEFTITDTEFVRRSPSAVYRATVTAEGLTEGEDFTVTYGEENLPEVGAAGEYEIHIALTDNDNYEISAIHGTQMLTVTEGTAELVLSGGNSPAAAMTAEELEQFRQDHMYHEVFYSPNAWADGANPDEEQTAWFMAALTLPELPYTALYADGTAVAPEDVSITIGGQTTADWLASDPQLGVYDMTYSFTDQAEQTVTAVRKLVYLPTAFGDANGDRNINVGDARYLQSQVCNRAEDALPLDNLYLYRVCDVDHNGEVNDGDATAIIRRMQTPLIPYYQNLADQ